MLAVGRQRLDATLAALALLILVGGSLRSPCTAYGQQKEGFKILHIMSYHAPWKWTDDQFNGFKAALRGVAVQYEVFQLNSKRKTAEAAIQEASRKARALIDTWQPDLVYANDDIAQSRVVKHYVNTKTPFVFSGVNANPIKYGFLGSTNVTGVMEQEHFLETVYLLKQIVPRVKKIAVIFDDGPTWEGVGGRMLTKLPQLSEVEVTSWDVIKTFAEYKTRIKALQTQVDAIALLGIFTFKDKAGDNVPYSEVLRWTAENSMLPDFSFWKDRIFYGTLCTVTVSGYEQGFAAGKLARRILLDGASPRTLTMRPSLKGEPVISLARANKLGIRIKANLLLSAEVVTDFQWDK
jgi:ABC-type uncharacterized transport system substrate-binding protein